MVLLLDGAVCFDSGGEITLFGFDVAQNHVGAGAFFVGVQGFLDVVTGGIEIGFEQRGLGKFAIKLCNFKLIGLFVVAEELRGFNGFFPVAVLLVDAEQVLTYESLSNYEYLKINNYVSYIKPIYYEKSKTRKYKKDLNRVENLEYNEEENRLFRKDGLELEFLYHGKDKKTIYFRNPETEKKVRYNYEFRKLSKESKDNIESEFGKQLRMNRSIQVEGAFAVIKEDMKLRKLKVRGKNSVKREIALFCIAYNFNRYISKLSKNKIETVLHSLKSA